MEEQKYSSEHIQHTITEPKKKKGELFWKVTTLVLVILLVFFIFTTFTGYGNKITGGVIHISEQEASDKVISFINSNLLQPPTTASLKDSQELDDLYKFTIDVAGREIETYATKDGKILFPQGIDLTAPILNEEPQQEVKEVDISGEPVMGRSDAKVTVIEFSDFQCPYCGAAAGTDQMLIDQFKSSNPDWEAPVPKLKELAKEGKIKLVFKQFPLNFHQYAQKAAEASECAYEQSKFWEYHDLLFTNQNALDTADLKKYAADLGLDTAKFNDCLDNSKFADEVNSDLTEGQSAGISGTPAYLINGKLISGAQPFSVFEQLIAAELEE